MKNMKSMKRHRCRFMLFMFFMVNYIFNTAWETIS